MSKGKWFVVGLVIVAVSAAPGTSAQERSYVRPSTASGDGPAFSGAVKVGNTLHVSGTLGRDADGKVPDDPKAEARLLLESFKSTMAEAGFTMDDLVAVTVYCSDVAHYAAWNEVYKTYFTKEFPARAFVGAGPLLFDARFEMQGTAVKR